MDAYALIGTHEPALHVRVHEGTPAWFLDRCNVLSMTWRASWDGWSRPVVVAEQEKGAQ